jgi:hypothetical protein
MAASLCLNLSRSVGVNVMISGTLEAGTRREWPASGAMTIAATEDALLNIKCHSNIINDSCLYI